MMSFDTIPIVNSWTEFGDLEYICVGSAHNACYPDADPCSAFNYVGDPYYSKYFGKPLGPRPIERLTRAKRELQGLVDILESEEIRIGTVSEVEEDIRKEMIRMRSYMPAAKCADEDKRISKRSVEVFRPSAAHRFDHSIQTPWFKNNYQFGLACPRDTLITLGNTILEAPCATGFRYFESNFYRDHIYKLWATDDRIHWKTAPMPSCGKSLYDTDVIATSPAYALNGYKTILNESEIAFDAADMMRIGKDVFYKKSESANNQGLKWLRREFPNLRFHMLHFPQSSGRHIDASMTPLRPRTPGSEGIILLNQNRPPLASEMKIFLDNDWKPVWAPLPVTDDLPPVPLCTSSLHMNLLSLSPSSVIIEECEVPMYQALEDLGFDVITVPLRALNEFGGGVHCVTWDVRRNDECKDYFPNQDYEAECKIDLNQFYDAEVYAK